MNNLYILPFHIARVCSASSHEYRSKSEATPSEKKIYIAIQLWFIYDNERTKTMQREL